MNLIEKFVYLLGWLRIFISPFSAGAIGGFLYWRNNPDSKTSMFIGAGIALVGMIIGIVWAEFVRRKSNTIDFISKVDASPDLDDLDKKQ